MENIILLNGKVNYAITLDPSVWIFDDRRKDLNTIFTNQEEKIDELEEYKKSVSKHWDREIMEGAIYPPTLKTEKKYEKEKMITGTFCMPLKPFLDNAQVLDDARHLIIETKEGEVKVPLEVAEEMVLGFSKDGKPLKEDGPVHCYYGDGSNAENPIKDVRVFRVE